jgi:LmbE family N-acetylglucosaminyl deacetylase
VLGIRLPGGPLQVLCLGAHADDIEIGCGGTLLTLAEQRPDSHFHWIVLAAARERRREAELSAEHFLKSGGRRTVVLREFRESYFPYVGAELKDYFETLKEIRPDLVLTHHRQDLHQDHRLVSELTWNTFRDQLILEYEIPKYDGDLGTPNVFVPLERDVCERKVAYLMQAFETQRGRHWFTEETFRSLLRLRGVECRAPSGYAEAFHGRKLALSLGGLG